MSNSCYRSRRRTLQLIRSSVDTRRWRRTCTELLNWLKRPCARRTSKSSSTMRLDRGCRVVYFELVDVQHVGLVNGRLRVQGAYRWHCLMPGVSGDRGRGIDPPVVVLRLCAGSMPPKSRSMASGIPSGSLESGLAGGTPSACRRRSPHGSFDASQAIEQLPFGRRSLLVVLDLLHHIPGVGRVDPVESRYLDGLSGVAIRRAPTSPENRPHVQYRYTSTIPGLP